MLDEAVSEYRKALALKPDFGKVHNNLAVYHYGEGDFAKAIFHCDKAAENGFSVNPRFLELLKVHRE